MCGLCACMLPVYGVIKNNNNNHNNNNNKCMIRYDMICAAARCVDVLH